MAFAGDHLRVLVGGYELTGDSNRVSIKDERKLYESTAFSDAVQNYVNGFRTVALEHGGYLNSQAAKSHPVLRGVAVSGVLSVLLGNNATPVLGDPVYSLDVLQAMYGSLSEVGKVVPFNARFVTKGERGGWGVSLAPVVSITNTTTGSGHDNGAASTAGGVVSLHVLQSVVGDTYSIIVEGATNAGFSTGLVTLATFTLNGTALGSERIAMSGSVPRYTRYKATRTGSTGNTLQIAVSIARN
jgi:hypothetical protein